MKAIIIDDENKARTLLSNISKENCPEITSIKTADDLEQGVTLIKVEQPDIVFLDIEMPNHSGLQILEFFEGETINFQIIFTTAYNKYAIEAFKLSAVDYLLKPIDVIELQQAVEKAQNNINQQNIATNLQALKDSFRQLSLNKIALNIPRGVIFMSHDDILYFEADGMYTTVFFRDGQKEVIAKPLRHFEEQIGQNPVFYKPHRSYLINMKAIKEFNKKEGGHLVMENKKLIPISRDKRESFFTMIAEMF